MERITWAAHIAYLDEETGTGCLILPDTLEDIPAPAVGAAYLNESGTPVLSGASLHAADWGAAVAALHRRGWEPLPDDAGLPALLSGFPGEPEAVALVHRQGDPATTLQALAEGLYAARAAARAAA